MKKGRILKIESKDYYVLAGGGEVVRCNLRGKFKKDYSFKKDKQSILDIAAVGDMVNFQLNKDGTGKIIEVNQRRNYLSRKSPKIKGVSFRGERLEQIIAANIDNLIVVLSVAAPKFNNRLLDRIIIAGESSHINTIIVINKIDLDEKMSIRKWVNLYMELGYTVCLTSALNKLGLDELKELLIGKINLFWGASGVGKSSILNELFPHLDLKVGNVSEVSKKGRHTTVTTNMVEIDEGGFIIDTPGMREIDPYGIKKQDLGHYFIEFNLFLNKCRFSTCTHEHEPGCAVISAVKDGIISKERYKSYQNLLNTIEEGMIF